LFYPKITIIIINYNKVHDTIECVESLIKAGADLSQIIIVDNGSRDNSTKILRDKYGLSIHIICLKENKGYPSGLNQGIPAAIELGAEWLLLMNNDVIVDSNFLLELNKAIENQPDVKLIGPTILYYDHPSIIWYIGYRIIPGTMIGISSYRGKEYNDQIPKYIPIDVMHGCTMMVNRDVFQEIGLFDDTNLIYGDDADFSWRARKAGFRMIAATRAKMWHKISLTMGKDKPNTRYLRTRNTIAFYKKYSSGITKYIMFAFTFSQFIIRILKDIFKGHLNLITPSVKGFINGWCYKQKETLND
jgi:GT2 family glycosyltransferase